MWRSWVHCLLIAVKFAKWPVLWSCTCLWSTVSLISASYQKFNFVCVCVGVCVHLRTLLSWFYSWNKSVILGTSYTNCVYLWILTICSWSCPWNIYIPKHIYMFIHLEQSVKSWDHPLDCVFLKQKLAYYHPYITTIIFLTTYHIFPECWATFHKRQPLFAAYSSQGNRYIYISQVFMSSYGQFHWTLL